METNDPASRGKTGKYLELFDLYEDFLKKTFDLLKNVVVVSTIGAASIASSNTIAICASFFLEFLLFLYIISSFIRPLFYDKTSQTRKNIMLILLIPTAFIYFYLLDSTIYFIVHAISKGK